MANTKFTGYTKGIALIISGLLIAFFPGIISRLFYIIGLMIVIISAISLLAGLFAPGGKVISGGAIVGIIIGAVILFLPSFVHIGIPLIAGVVFATSGLDRIATAIRCKSSGSNWLLTLIPGIALLILGGALILHPGNASRIARIIIGLVMIAVGVFNLLMDRKSAPGPGAIIDVDSYTVHDDQKYLK